MTIAVIPVLLGAGKPLFGYLPEDVALPHISTRVFDFGFVQNYYCVTRVAPAAQCSY